MVDRKVWISEGQSVWDGHELRFAASVVAAAAFAAGVILTVVVWLIVG